MKPIKLKSLITEDSKNVKILIKAPKGQKDEYVAFSVHEYDGVFVFLPKKSVELDKLELVELDDIVDSMLVYLTKMTKLDFKWNSSYVGAGYGFSLDLYKILQKFK
jgi:hypothetical protein